MCVRRDADAGPLDYSSFLTQRSAARKPSPIRALMPLLSIPGMIRCAARCYIWARRGRRQPRPLARSTAGLA
jgi:hypothetical protein